MSYLIVICKKSKSFRCFVSLAMDCIKTKLPLDNLVKSSDITLDLDKNVCMHLCLLGEPKFLETTFLVVVVVVAAVVVKNSIII